MIKIVATRCHILKLKCTKFIPDPAGGVHSAPQNSYLDLRDSTSKGRGGENGKEKEKRKEREKKERGVGKRRKRKRREREEGKEEKG